MSDWAIQAETLGKQYHIGAERVAYRTLRDQMADVFAAPFRRASKLLRGQATGAAELDETIWALRDVSFEVGRGEIVGIIGHNGAGKSTLLKLFSRITEPTEGYADIRGRVASLLEVGTGFHPELTGRENVYLNGAILGMTRAEIHRKFDEIVAFAEVAKFIDTPIKHYSSGMTLRLAFAVAAHLEPEILVIDEVLAVGDAAFQKKCINKMEDVGRHGRTILFVSHNMPAVTRLCKRILLLEGGRLIEDGPAHKVVGTYLNTGLGTQAAREWDDPADAPGGPIARLRAVRVRDEAGEICDGLDIRRPVALEMEFEVLEPGHLLMPNYYIYNEEGILLFAGHDLDPVWRGRPRPEGRYTSTARIPGNLLAEGMHFVHAHCTTINPVQVQFVVPDAVAFTVIDTMEGDSARGDWGMRMKGALRPMLEWTTEYHPSVRSIPTPAVSTARAASGIGD